MRRRIKRERKSWRISFPSPKGYGDYRDLIADVEVEAVHICTPNNLHYPMAKAAILAHKHVVCDKPLAMTAAEGADLQALAERGGA